MRNLSFRKRRLISLLVTALAILVTAVIAGIQEGRLAHASLFTGATVLGALVLLVLLGVRRRIPVFRVGSVSAWTQVHIYTGLFAAGVYVLHVPTLIAGGVFETGLSIVFLLVTASGLYGVYASRTLPRRLTAVEGQHRFDRVAWHRDQIATSARGLVDELNEPAGVQVLSGFYATYLNPFFNAGPSLAYVMVPGGARRRRLLSGLKELDRYLQSDGRSTAGSLAALVRRRDDLDYQFALQLRLRVWLVVHGAFSVVLVAGSIVHAVVALRFIG